MKRLAYAALLLGPLLAQPAAAQTTYQWGGNNRVFIGGTINGCNIALGQVTHSGSLALNSIMVTFRNRAAGNVRIDGEVEITTSNTRKSGRIEAVTIPANGSRVFNSISPGGTTLAGTTVTVRITNCQPA